MKHAPAAVVMRDAKFRRNAAVANVSEFSYTTHSCRTTSAWVGVLLQCLPAGVSSVRIYCPHGGYVKSLLDPTFKYVPSVETDIRKTFARIRREARRQPTVVSTTNDRSSKIALLFGDKKRAS